MTRNLLRKPIVPGAVAGLVCLVSIGSFLGRGSGWGARRVYAQDPIPLTFILPTVDSAATQDFKINFLNDSEVTLPVTLNIANEDGTPQAPSETETAAPHQNIQFEYTPQLETAPGSTVLVGAPFVAQIVMDVTRVINSSSLGPQLLCADAEALDKATKAVAWKQYFAWKHPYYDADTKPKTLHDYAYEVKTYGIACWSPDEPVPPERH